MRKVLLFVFTLIAIGAHAQNLNLRINEIIASNNAGAMDDFFETDDWVEIYNPPGSPITNLAGYYLSDDADSLDKWKIPSFDAGVTTILPNNFLIFWIDDDSTQGPDHVGGFTLTSDGEMFLLTAPDAVTVIDSITFGQQGPNVSYGRECDGCANWQFFNNVTFDDNNGEVQTTELVFVNEVQAAQTNYYDDLEGEYDAWIELYNPNTFQVNMANYTITVSGNDPWIVPNDNPYRTVVPPGGFMLVWCDGDVSDDTNHAPITLSAAGGTIEIDGPDGSTIETYNYAQVPNNQSYGRQNDGSVTSIVFPQPTPTVTNSLVFVVPQNLVINELLTANQTDILDNADEHEDWFEIYNPNNFDVNIAGYYFSDNIENPTKWIVSSSFADSVTVPALGWLLLWADDDQEQGVQHANFRLSNNGEYLGFFSPDGFTVVDEIQWGQIDPDTSLGRISDGNWQWVLFSGTTPDASNNAGTVEIKESETTEIFAYPNPVQHTLHFSVEMNVSVYTATGMLIEKHQAAKQIAVSDWSTGVYFLRTDEGRTLRLVKSE